MSFQTRFVSGRLFLPLLTIVLLVLPFTGSAKPGKVMINAISHNLESGNGEVVEFWLRGDTTPKVFMIPGEKPRLVIDFFNTGYGGPTQIEPTDPNLVQRIRVGFHNIPEPKTRVVIDLLPNRQIDWQNRSIHHNNTLRFTFKSKDVKAATETVLIADSPPAAPAKVPVFNALPSKVKTGVAKKAGVTAQAKEPAGAVQKTAAKSGLQQADKKKKSKKKSILQDVAFDDLQVRNGEMVLFKLNKFSPPVISAQEKGRPRVICDFENTIIAKSIASRIEAKGKFVDTIDVTSQEQDMARVVLNLHPGKDYDLQQVFFKEDKLFVLIVSDLTSSE
ncbi:AMIN domain-containing protein [Desulfosediminicola sp.]|uniref:AMIN domain-containing protein n=1 Tax=Desulfosediminicola sp. TaxID=2886825 RepID=UPI003AF2024D